MVSSTRASVTVDQATVKLVTHYSRGVVMAKANPVVNTGTAPNTQVVTSIGANILGPPRTLWGDAWRRFRKHKLAMVGAAVVIFFILAALFGPLIYRVDREALDFAETMSGSSLKHPMGTDDLGRDMLARVLYGGR